MIGKICIAGLLASQITAAQSPNTPKPTATAHAFEVVSMRPSKPGGPQGTTWGTLPDGYRTTGQSLWSTIMIAYFPQGMAYWTGNTRLTGAPPWLGDTYDISAKVSEADLPAWTKQNNDPLDQKVLFQQMLQSMLADRLKLVVHRVPGEISGFALVVGKRGPKLTESKPGATLPTGMHLQNGGIAVGTRRGEPLQWTFHSTDIAEFADWLSIGAQGHPIVNRTNFNGHYDFVLRCADPDPDHPDRGCSSEQWDYDTLGLYLEPIKIPVQNLVIDHIEKPSEN